MPYKLTVETVVLCTSVIVEFAILARCLLVLQDKGAEQRQLPPGHHTEHRTPSTVSRTQNSTLGDNSSRLKHREQPDGQNSQCQMKQVRKDPGKEWHIF